MIRRPFRTTPGLLLGFTGAVLSTALLIRSPAGGGDRDGNTLYPDFIEEILCPGDTVPADDFWERSFTALGFRPLNLPALARQHRIDYPVSGQRIWGLGPGDRILSVYSSHSGGRADVSIDLMSPPPTVHDVHLETDIRAIVDKTKCDVHSVRTAENKVQSRPMFDRILKRIEGWYVETDALEHN